MQKFAEFNDNFKYLLTCIDCFTRFAFAIPLKSKKPVDVVEAMSQIFKGYGIPLKVFTDKGTEFLGKDVKSFLKELGVVQWWSHNPGKAVMVERFNRTLKERLWVFMTHANEYRYIDALPDVVTSYNNSVHSSTGYAPSAVGTDEARVILQNMSSSNSEMAQKFKVGDRVRVSKEKLAFEKGYEANYSDMIFKIAEVRRTDNFYIYRLSNLADKMEPGWFYDKELTKVNAERETFTIAKILKQRKYKGRAQYLIRWVGYPSAFDSWEYTDQDQ